MPNAATARNLRTYLDTLSVELAACQTAAQTRSVKLAIRVAEIALTQAGQ